MPKHSRYEERLENVRRVLVRNANLNRVVLLNDFDTTELGLLGMTERGFIQFVRLNAVALGGEYTPSVKRIGNPRAFNCTERQTLWTYAKFRFVTRRYDG